MDKQMCLQLDQVLEHRYHKIIMKTRIEQGEINIINKIVIGKITIMNPREASEPNRQHSQSKNYTQHNQMQNMSQSEAFNQWESRNGNQYFAFVQDQRIPVQNQQMFIATQEWLVSIQQNSQPTIQYQQENIQCIPTSIQQLESLSNTQDQTVTSHAQPVQSSHNPTFRCDQPRAPGT